MPLTDYSNAKSNARIGIKSFWYMQLVLVCLFWLLALLVSQKPATHILQFLLPSFAKWSINQLCPCTFAEETIPAAFSTVNTTEHTYALLQDGLLLSFLSSDGFSPPPPEQPSTTQRQQLTWWIQTWQRTEHLGRLWEKLPWREPLTTARVALQ